MSLNKAIKHGKEHRKPYYGSARFDHSCRPHGSCSWCQGNRTYSTRKRLARMEEELEELEYNEELDDNHVHTEEDV